MSVGGRIAFYAFLLVASVLVIVLANKLFPSNPAVAQMIGMAVLVVGAYTALRGHGNQDDDARKKRK